MKKSFMFILFVIIGIQFSCSSDDDTIDNYGELVFFNILKNPRGEEAKVGDQLLSNANIIGYTSQEDFENVTVTWWRIVDITKPEARIQLNTSQSSSYFLTSDDIGHYITAEIIVGAEGEAIQKITAEAIGPVKAAE